MKKIQIEEKMKNFCIKNKLGLLSVFLLTFFLTSSSNIFGQNYGYKWLNIGSLQNFYTGYE